MLHYLSSYVGAGTDEDPFRPLGADDVAEWSSIDLRPPGSVEGRCLLAVPEALPTAPGRIALGDHLDGRSAIVRRGMESRLGVTLDDAPLRRTIFDLLYRHGNDARKDRWNQLKPEIDGWHRVWLGELVHAQPRMLALTIADAFTRADGTDISTGAPFPWTEVRGDAEILSNRLLNVGASANISCRAESDLATTNHYAQAIVNLVTSTTQTCGPAVRFDAAATTYYYGRRTMNIGSNMALVKVVAAVATALGTVVQTVGGSNVDLLIRAEANGSSLFVTNGTDSLNLTDTAITTGLRAGIEMSSPGGARRARVDNFQAGDLGVSHNPDMLLLF